MRPSGAGPANTSYHWAKADDSKPANVLLLEYHLADVGACFEALLRQDTITGRMGRGPSQLELEGG